MKINKIVVLFLTIMFLVLNVLGCTTVVGPSVGRYEIRQEEDRINRKRVELYATQLSRLNKILNRLIYSIPEEDLASPPQAYVGIIAVKIDKYVQQVYGTENDKGIIAFVISENSPAELAGIKTGDVIISINGYKTMYLSQFRKAMSNVRLGDTVKFIISRKREHFSYDVFVKEIPVLIDLKLLLDEEVNAATDGKSIYVKQGLINYADSDDEIAAVLAHELVHAVREHAKKSAGGKLLGAAIAMSLGVVSEMHAPGSGEDVVRLSGSITDIFNSKYSRDLEREADYFGAKYFYLAGYDTDILSKYQERFAIEIPKTMTRHYLSTHPSSAERKLRIEKAVQQLKAGKLGPYEPGEDR